MKKFTRKEIEKVFRDAGFSRKKAKMIASGGWNFAHGITENEPEIKTDPVKELIKKADILRNQ